MRQPPVTAETFAATPYPAVQPQICLKCAAVSLKDVVSWREAAAGTVASQWFQGRLSFHEPAVVGCSGWDTPTEVPL